MSEQEKAQQPEPQPAEDAPAAAEETPADAEPHATDTRTADVDPALGVAEDADDPGTPDADTATGDPRPAKSHVTDLGPGQEVDPLTDQRPVPVEETPPDDDDQ